MAEPTKYALRDLPGIAELEDLLRRIAAERNPEWTPLADGLDDKVDRLSRSLFGVSGDDTEDPPETFAPEIIGQMDKWDAWERQFYTPEPKWFDLAEFGWDVNNADGEELKCAEHFYRQIVAAHKGLMGRLPDAPRSDGEIAKNAADWARSLEADAAKFRRGK
ncbi:hypothetical protein [Phenylobacterium sp.]|jgi:hypothetical protein|uniref:hypothetical protein n=1 Tax=Phenylobacterium sp. TaxID=1871053 RepID=UPI002E2EC525|nr:hypothetical protein [Phenylobacterium sp.]HEX4712716.1 hypothetical protein [Phenylobacterium sp.]